MRADRGTLPVAVHGVRCVDAGSGDGVQQRKSHARRVALGVHGGGVQRGAHCVTHGCADRHGHVLLLQFYEHPYERAERCPYERPDGRSEHEPERGAERRPDERPDGLTDH